MELINNIDNIFFFIVALIYFLTLTQTGTLTEDGLDLMGVISSGGTW